MGRDLARAAAGSKDTVFLEPLGYIGFYSGLSMRDTPGLCAPEEPALSLRDLTGALRAWIEVGLPDADRLHRAAKAAPRVAVYPHRDVSQWLARLASARIHRASEIDVWAVDRRLLDGLVARLARRVAFSLSVSDRHLFAAFDDGSLDGPLTRHLLA